MSKLYEVLLPPNKLFKERYKEETMDSVDLLAREEEFKKLNKQLEKKTESLMKQIERSMQKQDIFSEFSHSLTLSPYHTNHNTKPHCCDTTKLSSGNSTPTKTPPKKCNKPKKKLINSETNSQSESLNFENGAHNSVQNCSDSCTNCAKSCAKRVVCDCCASEVRKERVTQDLEFLYAFVSVSVQENVLPTSFMKDRVTVESVCRFLSSKVKLMQEQIDKLQSIINKKAQQCEVHLTHQAELESERMTLLNKCNSLQACTTGVKAKFNATAKKLDEKDRLHKEQRSEADKLTSEVKRLRSRNASLEARSASLEDTVENLKMQVEAAKKAEKEFRDSTRSLSASHQSTITQLESRIKTMTTRIQRQEKLLQNLREQRAVLMAEGAMKVFEKEYSAFLTKDF